MVDEQEIRQIIENIAKDRFAGAHIVSVAVKADVDEDGEDVLIVDVVFDAKADQLDAQETSSLARRIIPEIEAIGGHGFPILSFIAKSELGNRNPEAA